MGISLENWKAFFHLGHELSQSSHLCHDHFLTMQRTIESRSCKICSSKGGLDTNWQMVGSRANAVMEYFQNEEGFDQIETECSSDDWICKKCN